MQGISKFIFAITLASRVLLAAPPAAPTGQAEPASRASQQDMNRMVIEEVSDDGTYDGVTQGGQISDCNQQANWCLDGQTIKIGAVLEKANPNGGKPEVGVVAFVEGRLAGQRKILSQDESNELLKKINQIRSSDKPRYQELMSDPRSAALLSVLERFVSKNWPSRLRRQFSGNGVVMGNPNPDGSAPSQNPASPANSGEHDVTPTRPESLKSHFDLLSKEFKDSTSAPSTKDLTNQTLVGMCFAGGNDSRSFISLQFEGNKAKVVETSGQYRESCEVAASDSEDDGQACYSCVVPPSVGVPAKRSYCFKRKDSGFVIQKFVKFNQSPGMAASTTMQYCNAVSNTPDSVAETAKETSSGAKPAEKKSDKKESQVDNVPDGNPEAIAINSELKFINGDKTYTVAKDGERYALKGFCPESANDDGTVHFQPTDSVVLIAHCPGSVETIRLTRSGNMYNLTLPNAMVLHLQHAG